MEERLQKLTSPEVLPRRTRAGARGSPSSSMGPERMGRARSTSPVTHTRYSFST